MQNAMSSLIANCHLLCNIAPNFSIKFYILIKKKIRILTDQYSDAAKSRYTTETEQLSFDNYYYIVNRTELIKRHVSHMLITFNFYALVV